MWLGNRTKVISWPHGHHPRDAPKFTVPQCFWNVCFRHYPVHLPVFRLRKGLSNAPCRLPTNLSHTTATKTWVQRHIQEPPNSQGFQTAWTNVTPANVKVCRLLGNVAPAKLWSNHFPRVKVCRLLGNVAPAKLWLNSQPKAKVCRLLGNVTPAKLWLNRRPKVKVCRLLGNVTPAKLWLNSRPKVKVRRLLGNATPAKLWLNDQPKVKVCRLLGNVTPSKLWLNPAPKVKVCRVHGNVTRAKLWWKSAPKCIETIAAARSVFTSSAVRLSLVSASMALQKLFAKSFKVMLWTMKLISPPCTCCRSGLEWSRIVQPEVSNNFLPVFSPVFSKMYLYTFSTVASSSTWNSKVDPSRPLISKGFADPRSLRAGWGKGQEETMNNTEWSGIRSLRAGWNYPPWIFSESRTKLKGKLMRKPSIWWHKIQAMVSGKVSLPVHFPITQCTQQPFSSKFWIHWVICHAPAHPAAGVHGCELDRWCFQPMKRFRRLETSTYSILYNYIYIIIYHILLVQEGYREAI